MKRKKQYSRTPIAVTILLSIVGALTFSIVLIVNKPDNLVLEIIKSIGLELAVSSIVVLITYLFVGETSSKRESEERYREVILETIDKVNIERNSLLPSKTFSASDRLSNSYLSFLYTSFLNTQADIIFADRITNLLRRLKTLLLQELSITVSKIVRTKKIIILLPNYTDDLLMENLKKLANLRERNNRKSGNYTGENDPVTKERVDVLRTLYVLNKLLQNDKISDKLNLNIEIRFYNDYPLARFEIMDGYAFISNMPIEGKPMPSTITYEKESIFYLTYSNYLESIIMRSRTLSEITELKNTSDVSDLSEEFFVSAIKELAPEYKKLSSKQIIQKFDGWYNEVDPFDVELNQLVELT